MSLFDRLDLRDGLACLDVGYGGGDATLEPARRADGLAWQEEIDDVVQELYEFAANPNTVAGMPRVVQAWARRPAA
jgi:ubiquinone/menaquinone biosynthesis C-methylase UbiE